MEPLTSETWADALDLYESSYTFVSVAPRVHGRWWLDFTSIVRLEARDPRGWRSIDPDEEEFDLRVDPIYPWLDPPATMEEAERFQGRVKQLPRASVRSLLVLLGILGMDVSKASNWERRRPGMEHRAEAIMSRFPAGTHFYSNLGWKGDHPAFYEQPVTGMDPFSQFGWDAGLIAVNDDEVAVFWTFEPI
ncbi:hypothetical protein [Streptomyces sp. NBC_01294]|uniref:hypothetical protein n=1 Tax=Streptomyces sp. NBC_01294 TaxID=2903815 RepID=UPI002DDADD8D|nr:hypothetical protein [Streptomyces sp. NBC_01294]WRZ59885.1 hypothetical protein OG534_27385 [Streptomyces sp. NBC_01294]